MPRVLLSVLTQYYGMQQTQIRTQSVTYSLPSFNKTLGYIKLLILLSNPSMPNPASSEQMRIPTRVIELPQWATHTHTHNLCHPHRNCYWNSMHVTEKLLVVCFSVRMDLQLGRRACCAKLRALEQQAAPRRHFRDLPHYCVYTEPPFSEKRFSSTVCDMLKHQTICY